MADVAVGLRDHSGWAVAVAVSDERRVVDRRRLVLGDPGLPRQVCHAAAGMEPDRAPGVIAEVEAWSAQAAGRELAGIVRDLGAAGHSVRAVAVPVGTAAVPEDLRAILASHPMLHAAEGQLYQEALAEAVQAALLALDRAHALPRAGPAPS